MFDKEYTIEVSIFDWHLTKSFLGKEEQAFIEANDWMESLILMYLKENHIEDEDQVEAVLQAATYTVTYEPDPYLSMFAVIDTDVAILGVYETRADAEEAILTEAEDWAYEVMMCDDPVEVIGEKEWSYKCHWKQMMHYGAEGLYIHPVPVWLPQEV